MAEHLGWHFLDSGSLYRVLAFAARGHGIAHDNINELVTLASTIKLNFKKTQVLLDGHDISADIRTEQCGQDASRIAVIPEVRAALLERQRSFAIEPGLVTDGRDMGTVVFPDAQLKIYLYASTEERANRRYLQLKKTSNDVSLTQVVDELEKRDARDTARAHSPLKPADDAVSIDTTGLTIVQVFEYVLQLARSIDLKGEK